jgi:putative ATP-dependent endonuclease of OLD family
MWIRQLHIENFRGIRKATVEFSERQTVLVGANGAGKSTIIEAIALLFGRDRLVRSLTEHDFFGSNPIAEDRIRIIATVTGFNPNIALAHSQWFSERRGVPKWLDKASGTLLPEQRSTTRRTYVIGLVCKSPRRNRWGTEGPPDDHRHQ